MIVDGSLVRADKSACIREVVVTVKRAGKNHRMVMENNVQRVIVVFTGVPVAFSPLSLLTVLWMASKV